MTESDDELAQVIAMLKADCAAKLPTVIVEIEDLWFRLLAGDAPLTDLPHLVAKAHGLAGACAMFGLPGVKGAARNIEQHLEAIRAARRLPNHAECEHFAVLIAALRQAM